MDRHRLGEDAPTTLLPRPRPPRRRWSPPVALQVATDRARPGAYRVPPAGRRSPWRWRLASAVLAALVGVSGVHVWELTHTPPEEVVGVVVDRSDDVCDPEGWCWGFPWLEARIDLADGRGERTALLSIPPNDWSLTDTGYGERADCRRGSVIWVEPVTREVLRCEPPDVYLRRRGCSRVAQPGGELRMVCREEDQL